MKRILSLATLLLLAVASFAHDFVVGGIYYVITSSTSNPPTVSVSYRGSQEAEYSNEYTGSVTIPETVTYSGKTYAVTSIGNSAFSACSGLSSITIPSSVTSIDNSAFSACSGLSSIIIPSSVTSIGNSAFYACKGLQKVIVPDFDVAKWCAISFMDTDANPLHYAHHLYSDENTEIKKLIIPSSVTSIATCAFIGCSGLTSITIPSSVTSIGRFAFLDTAWYNNQPDGLVYAGKVAYKYKGTMPANTSIVLEEGTVGIADYAFEACSGLTSVTIPSSVTSIAKYAFEACSGLTSVTIPSSVTIIGSYAFQGCSGLTSVTIPSSVTCISECAFNACHGLTSVTIPSSVTSIGRSAFGACSGLTSIKVDAGNIIYDSRNNCNAIIETSNNTIIAGCQNTVIPSSVTSIGNSAFTFCWGLSSITIPSSVTSIGSSAFYTCKGLTSITIPSSVTSIGGSAFTFCSGLTSVTISESVMNIGRNAFAACPELTTIYSYITSPTSSTGSDFSSSNYTNATLYVPKGTKALYQSADGWKKFQNIVEFDATAVQEIDGSETKAKVVSNYSIDGKQLSQPQKGLNILKMSDGTTRKVVK